MDVTTVLLRVAKFARLTVMPDALGPAIGTAEAMQLLGVSKDTLIRMAARGEITPLHKMPGITGAYVFDRAEVEKVAAERTAKAAS
jgi:excisionase family DNA binding protein